MPGSLIIRAPRPKCPSGVWLHAVAGEVLPAPWQPRRARARVTYLPELAQLRRRPELSAPWNQVPGLRLVLHGQLPSGKNQVGIRLEASLLAGVGAHVDVCVELARRSPDARPIRDAGCVVSSVGACRRYCQ